MKQAILALFLGAGVTLAGASWYFSTPETPAPVPGSGIAGEFDATRPLADRIAALEQAVSVERQARQLLQEEVFYLTTELEILNSGELGPLNGDPPQPDAVAAGESEETESRSSRRRGDSEEDRVERLVKAGFLPSQALWIAQREQELQMDALQLRFDAERSGNRGDWYRNRNMVGETLRDELGDADYERYLEANNRSTSISVSSIIESSPAHVAGLQRGDEILRYDGARVFSMTDLTRQTMEGNPGETVVVDIMRNGSLMQVVLPRGPVGVTGGRRRY